MSTNSGGLNSAGVRCVRIPYSMSSQSTMAFAGAALQTTFSVAEGNC